MIAATIPSRTQEGKKYEVYLTLSGWKCVCPDFIFRSNSKCKHIREAYSQIERKIA